MQTRLIRLFTASAGALLAAAAWALLLSNWAGPADLVPPHDPVLAFSMGHLFWIVGGLTLAVSLFCLFDHHRVRPVLLVLWLAVNFFVYRLGLRTEGGHSLAGLLSGFSYAFGISGSTASTLSTALFGYLFLGSGASLVWLLLLSPEKAEAGLVKMSCPSCGTHVEFAMQDLGQRSPCPHCHALVTLRKAENLKMSCFFCKEHIEFPAHAIGQKLKCPHCNMDITLKEPA